MGIGKEIGKKLSVASLGYDKPAILALVIANQTAPHFLARFVGTARGLRPYKDQQSGETRFGLIGEFRGTGANGETLDGSVLYLPSYVNDMLVAAFGGEDVTAIRIGFDVYAEYNEKSATSYSFTVNDLLNESSPGVDEVMEAVKALPMPEATPALPAPKK